METKGGKDPTKRWSHGKDAHGMGMFGKLFGSRRSSLESMLDPLTTDQVAELPAPKTHPTGSRLLVLNKVRPTSLPFHMVSPDENPGSANAKYGRKSSVPEISLNEYSPSLSGLGRTTSGPSPPMPSLARMQTSPPTSPPLKGDSPRLDRGTGEVVRSGLVVPDNRTRMFRQNSDTMAIRTYPTSESENETDDRGHMANGTVAVDFLSCPYIPQTNHLDDPDDMEPEGALRSAWNSDLLAALQEPDAKIDTPPPDKAKTKIDITYCISCGFLGHAHRTAHKLHVIYGSDLDFHFHPSPRPTGELEVYVNGKLTQSRLRGDGFSDKSSAIKRITAAIKLSRGLS